MLTLTREQRVALKEVYDRGPIRKESYRAVRRSEIAAHPHMSLSPKDYLRNMTYMEFRRTVTPLFGGGGCVMVPWKGMWVGIETDGHTHT